MITFETGVMYRFNTVEDNQLFTATIIEQDETHIKIKTIKGEEVILKRTNINKAKKWT